MLNKKEVLSLIALLDDDDEEVIHHVEEKLLSLGVSVIPILEHEWGSILNLTHQQKIENVIHRIQFDNLLTALRHWRDSEEQDLLDGVYIIAKYRYPDLDKQVLINEIDRIRLDIWLELHFDLSSFEKVRIINHILYQVHGFKGNTDQYHDPQNSFINVVLESKRGNPIMLAVVYMLIAQRLNIPIYGVNLPQHFVLAYKEENFTIQAQDPFNIKHKLDPKEGKVLFYINAFNQGAVFSKANLEQFLRQIKIEPKLEFFEPCDNPDIIKRVLRNLVVAYEKIGKQSKVSEVREMLSILGEPLLSDFEDTTPGEDDEE
ncbi:MAG: transglutaminase-like domain-containing protein [Bacteroidia bacterium]|jgi:regulator of sirC expression with transglutaminase-like and TPR domain